jgi:predicted metal-dependent hydrolase
MEWNDVMRTAKEHSVLLQGRQIEYRIVASRTARKLRIRVGLHGVEVFQPATRTLSDVGSFVANQAPWVLDQIRRIERLRGAWLPKHGPGQILLRGTPTRIQVNRVLTRARGNTVKMVDGEIVIQRGIRSTTPLGRSLERWLRDEAREAIETQLGVVTTRLRQRPARVYIMGQRTKWGNCSSKRNLSFNWRLILAPEFVLRYLVTHEAVHLAIPDHSAKFWLTVQSLCPETERAKQWLCSNGHKLTFGPELI